VGGGVGPTCRYKKEERKVKKRRELTNRRTRRKLIANPLETSRSKGRIGKKNAKGGTKKKKKVDA